MKRRTFLIIIILILFFNLFFYVIPTNYKKIYQIKNYKITEKFIKKDKLYVFNIEYNNDSFNYYMNHSYLISKKNINSIKKIKINDGYCLIVKSNNFKFYPVCKRNDEYISYSLISELKDKISSSFYKDIKTVEKNYDDIHLYYLNNKKYLLWNYRYFYYLNNKKYKRIDLFDNDYYQIELATKINNYLFIPNYDEGYSFNSSYVFNMKDGKLNKWKMKYEISTESRILGIYKKSIFLLDEKNEQVYEIVPHKMKIRKVNPKILEDGKFKSYSIKAIINGNLSFKYKDYYTYSIYDNKLYLEDDYSKTLLCNKDISSIVYKDKQTVYYLVGDNLYMYNPYYGNVLLISNFEWTFNSDNMIFIY